MQPRVAIPVPVSLRMPMSMRRPGAGPSADARFAATQ